MQRTRSYAFLITLCASLALGYTFVPEPNASYSTIRIAGYVGFYNSAWFGYVTAIMTSIFLALIGFYLVNSGIKKDTETKVGQVVAATPISNFKYLIAKVFSNYMLLLTIIAVLIFMSMILFLLYNDGYSFGFFQFIKPHLFITVPAMFSISVLAVVFEVCFGKYSVLQNLAFFFLFTVLLVSTPQKESYFAFDVLGNKIVMAQIEDEVRDIIKSDERIAFNIGYVIPDKKETKKFEFDGMNFPKSFILSRIAWMLFGIALIGIISLVFHRFDRRERIRIKPSYQPNKKQIGANEIQLSNLPKPKVNYAIFSLFRTEFLLLFRKGKRWLWILNIIGMILLIVFPLTFSHQIVLPLLWFLQVHRLSDITTKETTHNVHYFTFTAFRPMRRLLVSQLAAAITLMLLLSVPLIIRLALTFNFTSVLAVIFGAVLLVVLAATLGILSNGKKLFEVFFFMLTYTNINGISHADYFGGFEHSSFYLILLLVLILSLTCITFLKRTYTLNK